MKLNITGGIILVVVIVITWMLMNPHNQSQSNNQGVAPSNGSFNIR